MLEARCRTSNNGMTSADITNGTATAMFDDLGRETDRYRELLRGEWRPTSPTQEIIVEELARHAAALHLVARVEPATLRTGARAVALLQEVEGDNRDCDACLCGAVTSDGIEKITRYRRAHEKALHQTLQRLRELKEAEKLNSFFSREPPVIFFSQAGCEEFLQHRLLDPKFRCPHCGQAGGYWLTARQRLECRACRRQLGLRSGTVMENSRFPLPCWFLAIWRLLEKPAISLAELAQATKTSRLATLSHVARRVRAAMTSRLQSDPLAGIDRVYRGQWWPPPPEPGVNRATVFPQEGLTFEAAERPNP
jgi:transposase-like protein